MTPNVTVLGGTGHLGALTVAALTRAGLCVTAASRAGPLRVDVERPESWRALEGTTLLVDLTDATRTAPDELIAWCLGRGLTVVEATSDAEVVARLHQRFAGQPLPGRLVLGGGLFTGVSNLLGRAVARAVAQPDSLTLGVSASPFSGAGRGTIALMVASVARPVHRYVDGARVEADRSSLGPPLDFPGGRRPSLHVGFPEALMLHHSAGVPSVQVLFSPRPAVLVPAFAHLPRWVSHSGLGQALLRGYFTLVRRLLLGWKATPVELYACASAARGEVAWGRLSTDDGMCVAAFALAATVEQLLAAAPAPGLVFVDDVAQLEPLVRRVNELAGRALLALDPPRLRAGQGR